MLPDYYHILGINRNSTDAEVKKAYRLLALRYHPDRNNSADAHNKFIEINEAYLILNDKEARARYDELYNINIESPVSSTEYNEDRRQTNKYNDIIFDWVRKARTQSERYANMNYSDFIKIVPEVSKEIGFQAVQIITYTLSGIFLTSGLFSLIFGEVLLGMIFIIIGLYGMKYTSDKWSSSDKY